MRQQLGRENRHPHRKGLVARHRHRLKSSGQHEHIAHGVIVSGLFLGRAIQCYAGIVDLIEFIARPDNELHVLRLHQWKRLKKQIGAVPYRPHARRFPATTGVDEKRRRFCFLLKFKLSAINRKMDEAGFAAKSFDLIPIPILRNQNMVGLQGHRVRRPFPHNHQVRFHAHFAGDIKKPPVVGRLETDNRIKAGQEVSCLGVVENVSQVPQVSV